MDATPDDVIQALMKDVPAQARALPGNAPINDKGWWPSQQDVDFYRKVDATYGSPYAPNAKPGAAYVTTAPLETVPFWANSPNENPAGAQRHLNNKTDADEIMAQQIASERNPVVKLGWNPSASVSTTQAQSKGSYLPYNGLYNSKVDKYWSHQGFPATPMHEAAHRGLEYLRGKNLIKLDRGQAEELYVRALMQRAYGNAETRVPPDLILDPQSGGMKQIQAGKEFAKDPQFDLLEKIAAEEVARKQPRGPR